MPVDLGVFERQKSIIDHQQLQDAFELKKALGVAKLQADQEQRALAIDRAQREKKLLDFKMQESARGVDAPSSVREYEFFNQLPDSERKTFLDVKRAAQIQNLGGGFGVYNPVAGVISPISGGGIGLTPPQMEDINRKNRESEDQFNRGLDIKQKALEATFRLVGDPNAKPNSPEYKGNITGIKANRGGLSTLFPNVRNSSVDAEADLTTLENLLTTENLGLLKGVLSDTDMKVLASIGSGEIKGSDDKAIGAIRRMQSALIGKVSAGRALQQEGYSGMPPLLSDPRLQSVLPPPPMSFDSPSPQVDYKSKYGLK